VTFKKLVRTKGKGATTLPSEKEEVSSHCNSVWKKTVFEAEYGSRVKRRRQLIDG